MGVVRGSVVWCDVGGVGDECGVVMVWVGEG